MFPSPTHRDAHTDFTELVPIEDAHRLLKPKPKVYPLIGSVYGCAVANHDGKAGANVGWCEKCEFDREDERAFGFTKQRAERAVNPVVRQFMMERPKVTCWDRVVVVRTKWQHQACPHHNPCRVKVSQEGWINRLRPGHMMREGIPWSRGYAPKGYNGILMQDFLATFGRRYISPNFWTTNARRAKPFVEERRDIRNGKWVHLGTRARNFGDGGKTYCFESLEAAREFVWQRIRDYEKLMIRKIRFNPFDVEKAFFQWVRLRKLPYRGEYDNQP